MLNGEFQNMLTASNLSLLASKLLVPGRDLFGLAPEVIRSAFMPEAWRYLIGENKFKF
jgi:hypothetical protein